MLYLARIIYIFPAITVKMPPWYMGSINMIWLNILTLFKPSTYVLLDIYAQYLVYFKCINIIIYILTYLNQVIDINTGDPLAPGEQGEICLRGPQIVEGYLNRPDATKEAFNSSSWFHTGKPWSLMLLILVYLILTA